MIGGKGKLFGRCTHTCAHVCTPQTYSFDWSFVSLIPLTVLEDGFAVALNSSLKKKKKWLERAIWHKTNRTAKEQKDRSPQVWGRCLLLHSIPKFPLSGRAELRSLSLLEGGYPGWLYPAQLRACSGCPKDVQLSTQLSCVAQNVGVARNRIQQKITDHP